jgi:hypothetical protein
LFAVRQKAFPISLICLIMICSPNGLNRYWVVIERLSFNARLLVPVAPN